MKKLKDAMNAKDINVPTKWVSVNDRLPEKSGYYLTVTTYQAIAVRHYSTRWKAFNAFDELDDDTDNLNDSIAYWLPLTVLPEIPREGKNHAE